MKNKKIINHVLMTFCAALFIAFFLTLVNIILYDALKENFISKLVIETSIATLIGFPLAIFLSYITERFTSLYHKKGTAEYSILFNALLALQMDIVMNIFIPLSLSGKLLPPKIYLDRLLISYGIIFSVGLLTEKLSLKIVKSISKILHA